MGIFHKLIWVVIVCVMKVCISTIIQEKTLTSMFYLMEKEFSKHGSMLVRGRLDKVNTSSLVKVLRQPIFKKHPNLEPCMGRSLKVGYRSEGRPLAIKGITKLKHLWDAKTKGMENNVHFLVFRSTHQMC